MRRRPCSAINSTSAAQIDQKSGLQEHDRPSFALVALSGLYLVLVAIAAYGAGGYVAGRMRGRLSAGAPDEIEFRDGVHGAAVWALATLLTALIVFGRVAAPSSGPAGPSTSVAGENIIAYDIDRLFRGSRADANIEYARAEAARILLTASSHRGMLPEDRTELIRLVTARTGLGQPEAEMLEYISFVPWLHIFLVTVRWCLSVAGRGSVSA